MVNINKRTVSKPVARPKPGKGDVLDEAIDISEMENDFIKIVIYGQNRVGKTTLACKFPKPLLLVAFEPNKTGGAASVVKSPDTKLIRINRDNGGTKKALEIADAINSREVSPYKTVVIDSATSYQDLVLQELLNLDAVPEQLNWGLVNRDQYRERSEKTRECLRPFLNLNCHVVVNAKEKDHNPPNNDPKIVRSFTLESFIASDLGGATVGWLHDACDYICRLYLDKEVKEVTKTYKIGGRDKERTELVETGKIVRRLRTMYHPNYAAGFRSATPEAVPEFIESPDFAKIYKVIRGIKLP